MGEHGVVGLEALLEDLGVGDARSHVVPACEHLHVAQGIQLNVGGAVADLALDLGLVEPDQLVQVIGAVRIGRPRGLVVVEVHVDGRAGHRDLEGARRVPAEEGRLLAGHAAFHLQLVGDDHHRDRQFGVGLLGARPLPVRPEAVVSLPLLQAARGVLVERPDPAGAAEFAVAVHVDAGVLLQLQHVQDRLVLDGREGGGGHLAALVGLARGQQRLGTQQAADMVGPELRHDVPPRLFRPGGDPGECLSS